MWEEEPAGLLGLVLDALDARKDCGLVAKVAPRQRADARRRLDGLEVVVKFVDQRHRRRDVQLRCRRFWKFCGWV